MSIAISFPHPLISDENGYVFSAPMNNIQLLIQAYRFGFFPWDGFFNMGYFFFPRKRYIIYPDKIKRPKSINSYFNQNKFQVTINQAFEEVIKNCSSIVRQGQQGTWISSTFIKTYSELHHMGFAHSVEVWKEKKLVGGLYGTAVGSIFSGESMFSIEPNASRFGLIALSKHLIEHEFSIIDCQVKNSYLETFGGVEINNTEYWKIIKSNYFTEDKKVGMLNKNI